MKKYIFTGNILILSRVLHGGRVRGGISQAGRGGAEVNRAPGEIDG